MFQTQYIKVNGKEVPYIRIALSVSGNPRYVVHFQEIADDYETALNKARTIGGKAYRAKWFGGGIVISSYSLGYSLKRIIDGQSSRS